MKVLMVRYITLASVLLLSCTYSALVSSNHDQAFFCEANNEYTTDEVADTDLVLRRFAIEATVPQRGINCLSLNRMPTSTVFMLMQLACEKKQLAKEMKLDDAQLESFMDVWANVDVSKWDFHEVDEATAVPQLYKALSEDQRKMLELVALSIDGVSSLTRSLFIQELELGEEQISRIKQKMAELRLTRVKRIFQSTFAGPSNSTGYGEIVGWEHTKVAVECNQEVIAMLNPRQRDRLSQLVTDSEKYNELRARIVLEIFYPKSKPFDN